MVPDTVNTDSMVMRVYGTGYDTKDTVIDTHTLPLKIDLTLETRELRVMGIYYDPRMIQYDVEGEERNEVIIKENRFQRVRSSIMRWANWY
jgi:hypothetical protein